MDNKSIMALEFNKVVDWLVDCAVSKPGKELARNISPSSSYDEVETYLAETMEAESILFKKTVYLDGIYDVGDYVKRADKGSSLDTIQLLRIGHMMRSARIIKNNLGKPDDVEEDPTPIITSLAGWIFTHRDIEEDILNAIIGENEIADSASLELRNIRRKIVNKNQSIRSKLNQIITSSSYQKYLQDSLISIRGDRFVIPVKSEYRSVIKGIVHDQSSSGATLFIEPMSVVEMNNELRKLRLDEQEEIERILEELSQRVGEVSREIISNIDVLSKLDFIFAKGKLSIKMKGVTPKLNKNKQIRIVGGRHPMIPKESVVKNTVYIGENFNTLVITGPNTGGKTVTIKMVGLFCMMTQSGLNIPADYGTSMCVFDNIFADIGDEQSIEQSLSTFSSHMTRIVDIINNVSKDSIVIFDELGAGTDPIEGAALAVSILERIKSVGALCIATTHYSELKNYAITQSGIENAAVEFDVETLSPTYKLLIGVPGKSNAFEISKKLGLPEEIIQGAKDNINSDEIKVEDIIQGIEENRIKAQEDRDEAKRIKLEAERIKREYDEKLNKFTESREKMMNKARDEAFSLTRQTKEELDDIIKKIRKLERKRASKEKNREIEQLRNEITSKMGNIRPVVKNIVDPKKSTSNLTSLNKGDNIRVMSLNQDGTVVSADDDKKEAVVQIGVMKMTLPYKAMKIIEDDKKSTVTGRTRKVIRSKSGNVSRKLDLRGMNLEEAIMETEKYIDDCLLAGFEEVTIIHGVGTGILKSGLQPIFKKNKHIESFRPGEYGEGGIGVTIVRFK